MLNEELEKILNNHKLWINGEGGCRADLSGINLSGIDLSGIDLSGIDLRNANLRWADLSRADLSKADLNGADLSRADMSRADMSRANLSRADLSGSVGLIDPIDYLNENFDKTSEGYIAYKVFGMYNRPPKTWKIVANSIRKEVVNSDRTNNCGCGVNIATKEWIKRKDPKIKKVWKVLIKWEWLPSVIVPYNTDGKIRCGRIMLLEEVKI